MKSGVAFSEAERILPLFRAIIVIVHFTQMTKSEE